MLCCVWDIPRGRHGLSGPPGDVVGLGDGLGVLGCRMDGWNWKVDGYVGVLGVALTGLDSILPSVSLYHWEMDVETGFPLPDEGGFASDNLSARREPLSHGRYEDLRVL